LLFHCNNGYTNAPKCYVMRTVPVLLTPDFGISSVGLTGSVDDVG